MSHFPSHPSFFDVEDQLDKIHALNDFLVRLNLLIHWSIFLDPLSTLRRQHDPSKGGRSSFDSLLMFKILILKTLYNLSDENTELLIRDRLSFREFLGLSFSDTVPDVRMIWFFAELLKEQDMEHHLFDLFHEELARHGLAAKGGCRMDGTFAEVPKQHNSREKNAEIKRGSIPKPFTSDPHVGSHKDTDARWARKNKETHYGYKNYVLADSDTKLILDYEVTNAAVHDSIPCLEVVPPEPLYPGRKINLDSAYVGSEHNPIFEDLKERRFDPQIGEKGVRNHPLTPVQRLGNYVKSCVRCRIEHIFGAQKKRMGDEILRTIGMKRARFWIGMRNLVSNMCRLVTLKRLK